MGQLVPTSRVGSRVPVSDRDEDRSQQGMVPKSAKDARWMRVLRLVSSGQWYGHHTAYELAEEWGISPITVARYRTEAIRCIRVLVDDEAREEVREILAARCDRIYREAMDNSFVLDAEGKEHSSPDLRAASTAVRLHATLYGLNTKRVDVSVGELADKFSTMTDDELHRAYQELKPIDTTATEGNGHAGDVH